jgi:hypothetical protein
MLSHTCNSGVGLLKENEVWVEWNPTNVSIKSYGIGNLVFQNDPLTGPVLLI